MNAEDWAHIRLEMPVAGSDGSQLGIVEKAIVRPESRDIAAVVVETAEVPRRQIAVVAADFTGIEGGILRTKLDRSTFATLVEFDERALRRPPSGWAAPFGLPSASVRWTAAETSYAVAEPSPPRAETPAGRASIEQPVQPDGLPPRAGAHEQRQQEDLVRNPYEADPYDVLEPGVTSTTTPYEREDASTVNPLERQ